ncbi:MAG: hypothetical protein P4M15_14060 [Alphaproteobacteria bacterium]|nr:hypothetical protein [Alphaproteobacteria bacterium]
MALVHKLPAFALSVLLMLVPIGAGAEIPQGSTGMLRLSFTIGPVEGLSEPWLGLGFSHRAEATSSDLWGARDEGVESNVDFNLASPKMAFGTENTRTVLLLTKPEYRAPAGCDGPSAPSGNNNGNSTATNAAIAIGSAAVVGTVIYLLIDNGLIMATGC